MAMPSAWRSRPRRRARVSTAPRSLVPSTSTTPRAVSTHPTWTARALDGKGSGAARRASASTKFAVGDGHRPGRALLLCQWRLVFEGCVDGAGELSFEAADRFAACFAFALFAFEVSTCGWVHAALGDGDAVQGAVELAVAAAVEAVALVFAGAGVEWCDAGVAGELRVCWEAGDRADSQSSFAALKGPQPGSCSNRGASAAVRAWSSRSSSPFERVSPAAADEVAGDPHLRRLLAPGELAAEPVEPDRAVERPERHRERWVELVQVPAQPLLAAAPLCDQVVAVVDDQLQLPQCLLAGARAVEPWLLQRGPRDRERVDRVRLAARPASSALRSGQPWRHPHRPLTVV